MPTFHTPPEDGNNDQPRIHIFYIDENQASLVDKAINEITHLMAAKLIVDLNLGQLAAAYARVDNLVREEPSQVQEVNRIKAYIGLWVHLVHQHPGFPWMTEDKKVEWLERADPAPHNISGIARAVTFNILARPTKNEKRLALREATARIGPYKDVYISLIRETCALWNCKDLPQ